MSFSSQDLWRSVYGGGDVCVWAQGDDVRVHPTLWDLGVDVLKAEKIVGSIGTRPGISDEYKTNKKRVQKQHCFSTLCLPALKCQQRVNRGKWESNRHFPTPQC